MTGPGWPSSEPTFVWAAMGEWTLATAISTGAEMAALVAGKLAFYRVLHWRRGARSGVIELLK